MKRLEETYPADVASFEQSFPPLCENCAPRVEEIIKKKDYDAQVKAWSMFLSSGSAGTPHGEMERERGFTLRRAVSVGWVVLVIIYLPYRCLTGE
jgi:hypothetical protein